jgi:hypothetical protein
MNVKLKMKMMDQGQTNDWAHSKTISPFTAVKPK